MRTPFVLATLVAATTSLAAPTSPMEPDIPAKFDAPKRPDATFERREVMIPMRDGVKLATFILVPKGAKRAPMVLTRTPYDASKRASGKPAKTMDAVAPVGSDVLARAGYILVFQDIRGKHGSEGDYVMTRPLRGPLNNTKVDHSTDAYDTIDWLVKNVPESNGKVGMMGSSYEGFTVLMALVNPHPALKAAVPMCPMVDGWRGDDWFHNGAFRQINFGYFVGQTTARGDGKEVSNGHYDDYEAYRRAGSAGDYAKALGIDQLPYWHKLSEHAAYDAYWQNQALDKILAAQPLTVPTLFVGALYDQEDSYGAVTTYLAREGKDVKNDKNFLVLGPWRHSGMNYDGRTLGPLDFGTDTAADYRRDILRPFFDARLKDGAPAWSPPPVYAFETGTQAWKKLASWPPPATTKPKFYFTGFTPPTTGDELDEYVSDPAKPVPYVPRPVRFADRESWKNWLLSDQRTVADRPDVLVYQTAVLTAPTKISGAPIAHLFASTTGTDADWVVKLIDVYPDDVPAHPHLGGYQLPISMEIFRGRYRKSLETPSAITPNAVEHYTIALPHANHVFAPGHRIMVQIQSSWFPLYDRNPQTFVPNIFLAAPADYKKATMRVYRRGANASYIELPDREVTMKLYQFAYSPYAAKVRKYLELQHRSFDVIEVPYMDRNEVAQLSGQIVVPVLVDGATVVADSARITAYLDGATRDASAVVYEQWADSVLEDVAFRIASPAVETKMVELNRGREDARAMYRFVKERKFGAGCIDVWAAQTEVLTGRLRALLAPLADKLSHQPFLLGDSPTLADAAVWGELAMLEWAMPGWVARQAPEMAGWYGRL